MTKQAATPFESANETMRLEKVTNFSTPLKLNLSQNEKVASKPYQTIDVTYIDVAQVFFCTEASPQHRFNFLITSDTPTKEGTQPFVRFGRRCLAYQGPFLPEATLEGWLRDTGGHRRLFFFIYLWSYEFYTL